MDYKLIGNLIAKLRKDKNMTQQQLANQLNLSDKTISKWERGLGCPDVSLLAKLSSILGINIENILLGNLSPNDQVGGNMKKIKFYVCPVCKNIITSTIESVISCCGRKLESLVSKQPDDEHLINIEDVEDDVYITFNHDMNKEHYISFVAYVLIDRVLLVKMYPEQNGEVRFQKKNRATIFYYCTNDGLYKFG